MDWTLGDFIVAFVLIGGTITAYFGITKVTQKRSYRLLGCLALALVFGVIWVELAVGIFD